MSNRMLNLAGLLLRVHHLKNSSMRRNKYLLIAIAFFAIAVQAQHPFKYDNTVYQAVYLTEAFRLMDSLQNFLLLDVRSPGEYADTSRYTALNIGRIRGSVNISIDSVSAHLPELKKYADQPVFIYCSHSQRSRRVSKLLAENGFKKVYNINGGMTLVNESNATDFPYKNKMMVTSLAHRNVNSFDAFQLIRDTTDLVIIDIRTSPEFESKDSDQQHNIGRLRNAINMPQSVFAQKLDEYKIPDSKPVLLYDQSGINSMDVVENLRAKGFTRIYNLFDGLEGLTSDHRLSRDCLNTLLTDAPSYATIDPESCINLLSKQKDLVVLDARPDDEYNNKAGMSHANLGRIRGAVHITSLVSMESLVQHKDTTTQFLIYDSGSGLGVGICRALVKKGFPHVNYLSPDFYHFVWSVANVEDCRSGKQYLINHEGLY